MGPGAGSQLDACDGCGEGCLVKEHAIFQTPSVPAAPWVSARFGFPV